MIKLIATDMDGTLLDENKNFPPDFQDVLKRLERNGIKFIIASGRSYQALQPMFGQQADKMSFICDNGAFIISEGVIREINQIRPEIIKRTAELCRSELKDVYPVLCGLRGTYIGPELDSRQDSELGFYYFLRTVCSDLSEVDDVIFKIALYDLHNPKNNSYPVLSRILGDSMELTVSGEYWMDIMNKGVEKGTALSRIQKELGITKEETMAFGDFYNDISLLECAGYSYVMENANDDMKKHGKFTAEPNTEYGVTKAITEYLDSHGLI